MLSRDEFIREITLRICSSLEIKESLLSAFEYLKEQFPLEALVLFIIDERWGRSVALNMPLKMSFFPPQDLPLPEGMLRKIAARNFSEPFIVDIEKDEIFRAFAPMVKIEGNTHLIVPLRIRGELIGGLTLRARERDDTAKNFLSSPAALRSRLRLPLPTPSLTRRCSATRPSCWTTSAS